MDARNYKTLVIGRSGDCLTIDVPDRIWDADATSRLAEDLSDLCGQIAWMEEIRAILFSFAGDFAAPVPDGESGVVGLSDPVAGLKLPVIAAIRGDAIGPGLELALACDIRVGTEGACFGMPQVSEGRMPSNGGTQRLPRLIGPGRAMQMILTGDRIDAAEALRIGLLNRVVEPDALMTSAGEMAREMAGKSPLSTGFAKEAVYSGMDLTLDQGLTKELDLYLQLFSSNDRTEGITAFRDRRSPDFKGE